MGGIGAARGIRKGTGEYLDVVGEPRDKGLREGIAEDQLGSDDQDLEGTIRFETTKSTIRIPTFGVRPLNSAIGPSLRKSSFITVIPLTLLSKLAF